MDAHRHRPRVVADDSAIYTNTPPPPVTHQAETPGFAFQLLTFILDLLITLWEKGVPTWGELIKVLIFIIVTGYLLLKLYVTWNVWRIRAAAAATASNPKKKKIA
jgi:hypothetical protein